MICCLLLGLALVLLVGYFIGREAFKPKEEATDEPEDA